MLIPRILLISMRKKLFDMLDARKIHKKAIPRLGGVSFFPTVLFTYCLVYTFRLLLGCELTSLYTSYLLPEMLLFACGMTLLYLTGIADDLVGVRYRQKFVIQIFCACLFRCPDSGLLICTACSAFMNLLLILVCLSRSLLLYLSRMQLI